MFRRALLPQLLGQTPDYPQKLNGTFELAFNVGAKENVDTTFEKLVKGGATAVYAPRDEPWKMRSAMVADLGGTSSKSARTSGNSAAFLRLQRSRPFARQY
jgi:hypothetical protein